MFNLTDWTKFKAICITEKGLAIQANDFGDRYLVVGPDANGINWMIELAKKLPDGSINPDATDFETNVKPTVNGLIAPTSTDRTPQVNPIPAVDPKMSCFCPCAFGRPTPANPNIDIQVYDVYWQMNGLTLDVEGAVAGDRIDMIVGYMAGENFVTVSAYGARYYVRASDYFDYDSALRSNPIPQGLIMRMSYVFADGQNPSTPVVAGMYHMWRPYAQ